MWINEVGVAPEYQRAGLGRRLLEALFALGRDLGCGAAWVGTEHGNGPARGLYASAEGREEPFAMYSFDLSRGSES